MPDIVPYEKPPPTPPHQEQQQQMDTPFEGPEKKLSLHFIPKCNREEARSLRSLSRECIDHILSAAACSILSFSRNEHIDAYVLSESSLFIKDRSFTIKTCGTTTLLNALPTILHYANTLYLTPLSLSFSRVAYRFPDAQPFPHDCFENEVRSIDDALQSTRCGFDKRVHCWNDWYMYDARFDESGERNEETEGGTDCADTTLEMFMFDVDETQMSHYDFTAREHLVGSDESHKVTKESGIKHFLYDCDVIDAFNFAPCGYSMNALSKQTYMTMHITPEVEASYVSFEISGEVHNVAVVVAKVTRLFKPGRMTVVLVGGIALQHEQMGMVPKMFEREYVHDVSAGEWCTGGAKICVSSFSRERGAAYGIGKRFGAIEVGEGVGSFEVGEIAGADEGCESLMIVDLKAVERGFEEVQERFGKGVDIRYEVRTNRAEGIVALLDCMGSRFEAEGEEDLEALERAGVEKERIVLAGAVGERGLVERVECVAVFEDGALLQTAVECGACVEIRVVDGVVSGIWGLLKRIVAAGGRVRGVGFEGGVEMELQRKVVQMVLDSGCRLCEEFVVVVVGKGAAGRGAEEVEREVGQWGGYGGGRVKGGVVVGAEMVRKAVWMRVQVVGRKARWDGGMAYYVSDGVYGGATCAIMGGERVGAVCGGCGGGGGGGRGRGDAVKRSVVYGPTCDALDVVWSGEMEIVQVGEWLVLEGVGVQSGGACEFNGFGGSRAVRYVVCG
ncbi:S-adenosylmethionine decarboxylase proenzyme [Gracilariopsis chorda]|uniref:S-adenosylmethionine decarboxylase proenzyme n=1 Tax=Gracilariopsis chorda TaxID=448386 RepID=A0A2V3IZY9_9FLOR|nr:S-adenosylmethionine decarboxylase proenzyme [Gracilariopsis chorda]|eukprot:PXF47711.1 S-adenosylmethionine decarboxylase proenzyme [Gracilariopsis chorda]